MEIMIVVAILGVLAALAVPQFASATSESRSNSIRMNLRHIRLQLTIYWQDHDATYPTLADFVDQLTTSSDMSGFTAAVGTAGYPFGPYLDVIPKNSNTGTNTISAGAIGTSAWYYDDFTGDFLANDSAETAAY